MQKITVGILSDSHGVLDSRISDIVNRCDHIIHAGDICNASVLEQLKPKLELHAVAGNNDYPAAWHINELEIVSALPKTLSLELPGGNVVIEHGHRLGNHPCHDQFRNDHEDAKLVVYGHTHKRIVDQSGTPWIVNPGASGRTRTKGGPSCLVLTATEDEWHIETVVFSDAA